MVSRSGAESILAEEVARSGLIQHGNVGQGNAAQGEGIDGAKKQCVNSALLCPTCLPVSAFYFHCPLSFGSSK